MKLTIGEIPNDHPFVALMRPIVEGAFKLTSWMIVVAAISYAQEKTGSTLLWVVQTILQFLIFGFVWSFIDWLSTFRFNASGLKVNPDTLKLGSTSKTLKDTTKRVIAFVLSGAIYFSIQIAANIVVAQLINSLSAFQKISH